MPENKFIVVETISVLFKITNYKLNGPNYLDWITKIKIYLRSVEKDDHFFHDPSIGDAKKLG